MTTPSTDRPTQPGNTGQPRRLDQLAAFDPITVAVVRASCSRLPENAIVVTQEFYAALFEMAPATRAMFPDDLKPQTERLLQALLAAVNALDDPAALEPQLRAWGAYHRRAHGVTNEMYVFVGHALVRAVRKVLGPTETSVGSAWIAVYEWLAAAMIAGADDDAVAEATERAQRAAAVAQATAAAERATRVDPAGQRPAGRPDPTVRTGWRLDPQSG